MLRLLVVIFYNVCHDTYVRQRSLGYKIGKVIARPDLYSCSRIENVVTTVNSLCSAIHTEYIRL